jgi:hypothetical protein
MSNLSRFPNLIIAGVHKAGTTSLFVYLSRHPDICASQVKETGFFMPLRDGKPLPPLEDYQSYFRHCRNERYVMEASPSYLYGKEAIAQALQNVCGKPKVLMILREPVDRLQSFYHHIVSKSMITQPGEIQDFVRRSLDRLNKEGEYDYFSRGVREGCYADYLEPWFQRFGDDLRIVFFDDLQKKPGLLMHSLWDWLDLSPPAEGAYSIENKTVYVRNPSLHKLLLKINHSMEHFWRRHHGLKKRLRRFYYTFNARQGNPEGMTPELAKELREFYRPYNRQLAVLLKQQGYKSLPSWVDSV